MPDLIEAGLRAAAYGIGVGAGSLVFGSRVLPGLTGVGFFLVSFVFSISVILGSFPTTMGGELIELLFTQKLPWEFRIERLFLREGLPLFVAGALTSLVCCYVLIFSALSASWVSGVLVRSADSGSLSPSSVDSSPSYGQGFRSGLGRPEQHPIYNLVLLLAFAGLFSTQIPVVWLGGLSLELFRSSASPSFDTSSFLFFTEQIFWLALIISIPIFVASLSCDLITVWAVKFLPELQGLSLLKYPVILAFIFLFFLVNLDSILAGLSPLDISETLRKILNVR